MKKLLKVIGLSAIFGLIANFACAEDSDLLDNGNDSGSPSEVFAPAKAQAHHQKLASNKASGNAEASRPATGRKVFIYNPRNQVWSVYDESGRFIRSGHGSSGRSYCPDIHRGCRTPSGTYSVYAKAGPYFKSSRFPVGKGGAPMPYAMFFHGGYAIHGSNDVPGYNASHGCIRVYTSDARWLNQNFLNYGSIVVVKPY